MREVSVPPVVATPVERNLTDLIYRNASLHPNDVAFRRKVDGRWQAVTTTQFLREVIAVAKGLVAAGIGPGDRVGLMSRTRYEWTVFDFAIWCAGATTVPIYETSSVEQVGWILSDSEAVACVVEGATHRSAVEQCRSDLPKLNHVWQIVAGAVDELTVAGRRITDAEIEARRATLTQESLATLIYTSGTTGRPKGCELSHGNFLAGLANVTEVLGPIFRSEDAATLLFLPLAHVFGRIIQIGCVYNGRTMGHCPDIAELMGDLLTFRPTFLLAVPRVFEKVYNSAAAKAEAGGGLKTKIFHAAVDTAIDYSRALDSGGPNPLLAAKHWLFDHLVYAKLKAALGGRTRYAISGGGPLGARLGHFFRGVGVTVLEGYGLTETTGTATVNPAHHVRIGTVGRAVPGTAIRIAEDGEILLKGGPVFHGYWANDAATKEAIEPDGWFHTGDIGALDDEGFLRITGRKKEIIVTAAGKNVAPAVIEDRIRAHPLVSQVMVVGDNRPFISALVTIDQEFLPHWKSQHGKPAEAGLAELLADPDLNATVQQAVDEGNKAVSRAESVRKFHVLPTDWTVEGGQLTPSLKLKRDVVLTECGKEIESLYAG